VPLSWEVSALHTDNNIITTINSPTIDRKWLIGSSFPLASFKQYSKTPCLVKAIC
jgi:hypothetical protein